MLDRLIAPRLRKGSKSVLLLGPRQVGKSTLCRSLNPDKIINLSDEDLFLTYSKDPSRLRRELQALAGAKLILIDKIQRVPPLLNTLQAILDEGSHHRFLLTGSSARKLKRGGANLLPGRIILEHLDPLSAWELPDDTPLPRLLQMGSLPGVFLDPEEGVAVLESYANTYLREEIQAEAVVKSVGNYARFLDIAADASGSWINYSKLSSDSEIPKETVRRYFDILEETLLAFRLPAYRPLITKRRISQRDRFLFFDTGVRNALLSRLSGPLTPTEMGLLFESWVILQCLFFVRAHRLPWRLSSYRTDAGAEVDLILETPGQSIGVECKFGRNVAERDFTGLRSFESISKKPVTKIVVYGGAEPQTFARHEFAYPYRSFLNDFLPGLKLKE